MTDTPESWRRTFPTVTAAVDYLKARGFSVGHTQSNQPRGVMLGRVDIRKWRDLSAGDRLQLHGLVSTVESGAGLVTIYGSAPAKVHDAVRVGEKEPVS